MNRRSAVAALLFTLAAPARLAAQTARVPRIGYLTLAPLGDKASDERLAFLEGLRELGYVDGKTVEMVYRSGEMNPDILEFAAQALVDAKVDVIAASGTVPALVAKKLTRTIPIVMIFSSEPVLAGLVVDLARPVGNVTGVATIQTELDPKRLAMLKEISPTITRVAVLWTRFHPSHRAELQAVEKAGQLLGLTMESFDVTDDLLGALRRMETRLPDAIFVLWDVRTLNFRQFIIEFALKHNLPTSMPLEPYVEAGGLISYGPNVQSIFRRSATYVHRILQGAKPADLPVERPSKFDLVVNLKTAEKLKLKLPHALLLLADRVIQ
jgi:putative tryptophan/tyrosine transport system substrate-binding protein